MYSDGLLVYTGSESGDQWLSLSLVDGHVEFQYSLGVGSDPLVLVSATPILLGQWHTVKAGGWDVYRVKPQAADWPPPRVVRQVTNEEITPSPPHWDR